MSRRLGAGGNAKPVVVADASVIVKWFVEEKYSEKAILLRDAYSDGVIDIAVPCLMYFEVLNALKYSMAFGEEELKEIASILADYQFDTHALVGEYAEKTVVYAMRKGITIYDAAYVALADILGATLYTADEKLLTKTSNTGFVKHISLFSI